jgi:hypothetical protein
MKKKNKSINIQKKWNLQILFKLKVCLYYYFNLDFKTKDSP